MKKYSLKCLLLFGIWLFAFGYSEGIKAKTLKLPFLVPITGDEPRIGEACITAANIAFENVNNRQDILAGYQIQPVFLNEGPGSMLAPGRIVNFQLGDSPSPIVIGPFFTPGCKASATFTHQLKMVQIAVGCASPLMTANRRNYPNMYRLRAGGEATIFPQLRFVKEIGKWQRFAIVTWAGNAFDYGIAQFLLQEALSQNVSVPHFDIAADIDEAAVMRLAQSDLRIVALEIGESALQIKFMCYTYKHGMTGPKYVFMVWISGYSEVDSVPDSNLPPGCTRDILKIQYQSVYLTDYQLESEDPARVSALGYSLSSFDILFFNKTGNRKPADYVKRAICQDAAAKAILTLDQAERLLNQENMTLSDFSEEANRDLIMKIVNKTAASSAFVGLRAGLISYSPRLEFDQDNQVVIKWTPNGLGVEYKVQLEKNDADPYQYENYKMKTISETKWTTKNGQPPRDKSITVEQFADVPGGVLYSVIALSIVIPTCQFAGFTFFFPKINSPREQTWIFFGFSFLSTLLFNAAAITFSAPASAETLPSICALQAAFTVAALTSTACFFWYAIIHLQATTNDGNNDPVSQHQGAWPTIRFVPGLQNYPKNVASGEPTVTKKTYIFEIVGVICIISFALTTFWLVAFPIGSEKVKISGPVVRADDNDVFVIEETLICQESSYVAWLLGLAAWHLFLLASAAFQLYHIGKSHQSLKQEPFYTSTAMMAAAILTLLCGAILITAILPSPISKRIALSYLAITFSAIFCAGDFIFGTAMRKQLVQ